MSERETVRYVRCDQEVELSSRRKIARWVSRSGDISLTVEGSTAAMTGRVSTEGAPGAVSRSVACAPKRRVASCFAAVWTVGGVV